MKSKAHDLSPAERIFYAGCIRKSGARTLGFYIDKRKDVPDGWKDQKGSDNQIGILRFILESELPAIESERITVVIDDHQSYHGRDKSNKVEKLSKQLSDKFGKDIMCITSNKKNMLYRDHIETNDAVTFAIYAAKEKHRPLRSAVMRQSVKRLRRKDSIRNKQ